MIFSDHEPPKSLLLFFLWTLPCAVIRLIEALIVSIFNGTALVMALIALIVYAIYVQL